MEVRRDTRGVFDSNVLTYISSFVLVAVLTLILNQADKNREEIEAFRRKINDLEKEALLVNRQQYHLSQANRVYSDCVLISAILGSNELQVSNVVYSAFSKMKCWLADFIPTVQQYCDGLRDDAAFRSEDIRIITAPLKESQKILSDIISLMKRQNTDYHKELFDDAKSSVDELIRRYESYLNAPVNQKQKDTKVSS